MFRMVSLRRDPKSGAYKARKAIPADIQDIYQERYGVRHERTFYASARYSLSEAKQRFLDWQSKEDERIELLRRQLAEGETRLSHHDLQALIGRWFDWFVKRHSDNPGSARRWSDLALACFVAKFEHVTFDDLNGHQDNYARLRADPRHRAHACAVVREHGLATEFFNDTNVTLGPADYEEFLACSIWHLEMAALQLAQHAEGDYSPSVYSERFPKSNGQSLSKMTCEHLCRAWVKERQPKNSTITRRRPVFDSLASYFGDRSIDTITANDAVAWKNTLITEKRSAKTVNETWLGTAKSIFNWAKCNKLIEINPFADLKVVGAQPQKMRETPAFTEDEAKTILRATTEKYPRIKPYYQAARRWVPWLCAYSGARVGEMTQLRKEDIQQRHGIWTICITPEAHTQKTGQTRYVPIHKHIIEQGFLDFVGAANDGPLFYDPEVLANQKQTDPLKPPKHPAEKCREHLAKWVRDLGVVDKELSPNHAWRHTFKQITNRESVGISEKTSDAITGHAPPNIARKYGPPTLKEKAEAFQRFPRFSIV